MGDFVYVFGFVCWGALAAVAVLAAWTTSARKKTFFVSIPVLFVAIYYAKLGIGNLVMYLETGAMVPFFVINLGILGVSIGFWIATAIAGFRPSVELARLAALPEIAPSRADRGFGWILLGVGAALGFVIVFYSLSGVNPVLHALQRARSGDLPFTDVRVDRVTTTYHQSLTGQYAGMGYLNQFRLVILPMLCAYCLISWRITRSIRWRNIAMIATFLTFLALSMTGERDRTLNFLLTLFIAYAFFRPSAVRPRLIVYLAVTLFVVYIASTFVLGRFEMTGSFRHDLALAFENAIARITHGNARVSYFVCELYDQPGSREGGRITFGYVLGYLPGTQRGFSADMMLELLDKDVGAASATFAAEAYADFGLWGPLAEGLVVGLLVQAWNIVLIRMALRKGHRTPNMCAFYGMSCVALTYPINGSVFSPITYGLASGVLLYLLVNVLVNTSRRVDVRDIHA